MDVTYIKEADAPKPPKPVAKGSSEIVAILQGLKDGQVARIVPPEGKSLRGMKVSFGRIATGQGMKVETWSVPGEDVLYVKRSK